MNKLVGINQKTHRPFLALVLEPGNLKRLTAGEPIQVNVDELFREGIPASLDVEILYSDTPVADAREFAKMAAETSDERTPANKTKRPHCQQCHSTIEQMGVMRNDSPIALVFCPACGCVLGTVPGETVKNMVEAEPI